jgi:protein SCO1/2
MNVAARSLLLVAASWVVIAGADNVPPTEGRTQLAPQPAELADFTLNDTDGKPLRFSSLRGRETLVFFGFTHCPSVCPAAMFKLRLLTQSMARDNAKVPQVLLISIDGDRDTPEVMKAYLAQYSTDFLGMTGDPKAVRGIAAEFKAVFFKGLPSDNSGNYVVEHTSQVYLVDADGKLRATFFDAPVEAMAEATKSVAGHAG